MKLSTLLLILASLTIGFKASSSFAAPAGVSAPASSESQPQGIFHFDAEGNLLQAHQDTENFNDWGGGGGQFPEARSCSCNLTNSCWVSCNWNSTAICNAEPWNGAFYCSCYCN